MEHEFTMMLVDDNLDQRKLWAYVAKSEHTVIAIKRGGISALQFLNDINYEVDAIITDLAMGDMDGITLTEQIRKNEIIRQIDPLPVFWFTGWKINFEDECDPIIIESKRLQVRHIFIKPYDPFVLLANVRNLVTDSN